MTWNYRIIKSEYSLKEIKGTEFAIHEVYYDKDYNPTSWTEKPSYLCSETKEDLLGDLILIRQAFKRPVLVEKEGKLYEESLVPSAVRL